MINELTQLALPSSESTLFFATDLVFILRRYEDIKPFKLQEQKLGEDVCRDYAR